MSFGGFGPGEMILVFLVVLLLFGAKRLPEIGSSLGKGIREFKSSVRDIKNEVEKPEERRPLSSGEGRPEDETDSGREEPSRLTSSN